MKRYRFGVGDHVESIDMAKVLMLLSRGGAAGAIAVDEGDFIAHYSTTTTSPSPSPSSGAARVFECKTCSRRFPSFQALGGHRASHKKPRLAAGGGSAAHCHESGGGRPRVHECAVCGHEFAVGQALGGHMRRHRVGSTGAGLVAQKKAGEEHRRREMMLDLNLPPLENDLKLGMDKILLM